MKRILFLLSASVIMSCACQSKDTPENGSGSTEETPALVKDGWSTITWNFDNADGWEYTHQDDAPTPQWSVKDGMLKLWTRAGTHDRSKLRTLRSNFGEGLYTWKIQVPAIAAGEQASIAGFIYLDDAHELDFEIGYGTAANREKCGAEVGQMVACMTNQGFPFISEYTPINPGWHEFSISLMENDGKYTARWIIDGEVKQTQALMFGPETKFKVYCSVENLLFMGDHTPEYDNFALFDWVSVTGPEADKEPEEPIVEPPVDDPSGETRVTRWDFDSIDGWYYYTHNPGPVEYFSISGGMLSITTKGNTMDRNKLQSNDRFGQGVYTWRLHVPEIEPGAQVSVGAFIYQDDEHELDFEIGYGKAYAREGCGAADDELVACLTNQKNPHNSTYVPIKPGWHVCAIKMDVNESGLYKAIWIIDDVPVKELQLSFGPAQYSRFLVACSVENLTFLGDHMPTRDHTALFDWVTVEEPVK